MVKILRRDLFKKALVGAVGLVGTGMVLQGCKSTTNGSVTTATLDVKTIDNYAQGVINGGEALLSAPALTKLLGTTTSTLISNIVGDVGKMLSAFDTAANGAVSISYDNTNGWTAATTILTDAQNLLTTLSTTVSAAQIDGLPDEVRNIIAAVRTVVTLLQTVITTAEGLLSTPRMALPMTEAQALHILKVNGY